ncbi:hypothetical protein TeGR_g1696, partial [Tetraparma gracilis]
MAPLTLAFGSCHRIPPSFPSSWPLSSLFPSILSHSPSAFLWLGDAVYPPSPSLSSLRESLSTMRSFPPYAELLSSVPLVLGTVDDHDHGLNDAGRELPDLAGRRDAYLEFLGEPSSEQPGVYSSRVLGSGADAARVIFLDTRHNRDLHWLPSVGGVKLPLFPVVAAFGRFLTSELGLGSGYAGRVLGEEQWGWLEGELGREPEGVTVVVSSIQVLTTNPLVESWGHFPKEKVSQVRAERKHVRRAGDRAGRRG